MDTKFAIKLKGIKTPTRNALTLLKEADARISKKVPKQVAKKHLSRAQLK